jgi:TrmH family RNA methyltransferase
VASASSSHIVGIGADAFSGARARRCRTADPGNAGAIIRSAAAAGATGVVLDELLQIRGDGRRCAPRWGAPAAGRPQPRVASLIKEWKSAGTRIVATARGGAMHDVDFTKPIAVLLGGEGGGLSEDLAAAADTRVSIPMHGAVESLNAAVAAAILLRGAASTPFSPTFEEARRNHEPLQRRTRAGRSNTVPLAERMRPRSLDEIVGQDDLVAPGCRAR